MNSHDYAMDLISLGEFILSLRKFALPDYQKDLSISICYFHDANRFFSAAEAFGVSKYEIDDKGPMKPRAVVRVRGLEFSVYVEAVPDLFADRSFDSAISQNAPSATGAAIVDGAEAGIPAAGTASGEGVPASACGGLTEEAR